MNEIDDIETFNALAINSLESADQLTNLAQFFEIRSAFSTASFCLSSSETVFNATAVLRSICESINSLDDPF